ncbi:MAG: glycosyltransferase, partial [Bacteroidota bacterium]
DTIQSVIDQSYDNFEILVIDGGSDDGTIDIIKEFQSTIKLLDQGDKGIYDAMNKGIDQSNGDWLIFLGGDDRFYNKTILKEIFSNDTSDYYLMYGNVEYDNKRRHKASFGKLLFFKNTIHQQGAFYNRKCFENNSGIPGNNHAFRFNADYKVLADYALNLILYKKQLPVKKVNGIISMCGLKGVSKNISLALYREELRIKRSIFKLYTLPLLFVWVYFKYLVKKSIFF